MEDKRGGGQISGIDSVYMSSGDADSMRETWLDYKNNKGVSGIQRVPSASPPHDTDVFHNPQLPSEFQSKDFQKFRERGRSSSLDSIIKSSDFVPLSQSAQETSDVTCSIKVSSLPPNISEELINDFFENTKRSGGGDVECVAYDETKKTAIITFQDPSVVESVLKKHKTEPLTMDEMRLQIEEHHQTTIDVVAVKVTNLPPKIRKLQIELFFENPKKSGCSNEDLEKVDYDEATHCAIVWLKKSEVVTKVLEKHKTSPFTLNKQKVEVKEYRPAVDEYESSSKEEGGGVIEVTNIPSKTTEEELVLFFENRRKSGRGDVKMVEYNMSTHMAVIWFKKEDAASRVLQNFPLLLSKKQIHVQKMHLNAKKVGKMVDQESSGSFCTTCIKGKIISDDVQWYYVYNSEGKKYLIDYPGNINLSIEKAYRNKDKEVRFMDDGGTEFAIDFYHMEEYPTFNKSDVTIVTRRDKIKDSTFEPPSEWSAMKDSDNLVVVLVKSGSPEYSSVIDRFHVQVGKTEIVQLERIQNKMLYQQYVAKKKLLDSQNPKGTKNERGLWHGTAPEAVSSINSLGFNRSYCGKNALRYGEGVYFAVDAGYGASDFYSRPDKQGLKRIYLCKVLTGEFTQGQAGMRVPPAKQGQQSHILYDSVVNNVGNPLMCIIFNNTQAYPDYLITFK